jgi:hypothetical protein
MRRVIRPVWRYRSDGTSVSFETGRGGRPAGAVVLGRLLLPEWWRCTGHTTSHSRVGWHFRGAARRYVNLGIGLPGNPGHRLTRVTAGPRHRLRPARLRRRTAHRLRAGRPAQHRDRPAYLPDLQRHRNLPRRVRLHPAPPAAHRHRHDQPPADQQRTRRRRKLNHSPADAHAPATPAHRPDTPAPMRAAKPATFPV